MRQKYNYLDVMGPIMPGKNQTLHSTVRSLQHSKKLTTTVKHGGGRVIECEGGIIFI
jgi:hypothetical protein